MIQIGDKCPDFQLPDATGKTIKISDFIGKKKLVIYFYPKDDTTGCTKEACSFRDSYEDFKEFDCEVIGISSDDEQKHASFASKHRLPFILLADKNKTVRKLFGVPGNLFGLIPGRVTYIIGIDGIVKGVYNSQTNPLGHIEKALELVKSL
ncbi:MAG: peroxiredoxin [Flavobacteriales bacterium]|nr:peroxiredoxin [Flavobacteriales bacterium]